MDNHMDNHMDMNYIHDYTQHSPGQDGNGDGNGNGNVHVNVNGSGNGNGNGNGNGSNGLVFDASFPMGANFIDPFWRSLDRCIEPRVLTTPFPHTSHDDSCVGGCNGSLGSINTHGFRTPLRHPGVGGHFNGPRYSTPCINYQFSGLDDNNAFLGPQPPIPFPFQLSLTANPQATNMFNVMNPALFPQNFVPEDCTSVDCSQACSSQCCGNEICEDEDCADSGTPCNDAHCYEENNEHGDITYFEPSQSWNGIWPESNCKHTNEEHNVALTLRNLGAPESSSQSHSLDLTSFECPLALDHHLHATQPETPRRSSCRSASSSISGGSQLSKGSTIAVKYPEPDAETDGHTCQWTTVDERGNPIEVCGLVFDDNEKLQEHLCQRHISHMSSKTKYRCLWAGCPRKAEQNFASRNKLRRHISTHTHYANPAKVKPHKCPTCLQGFSAKQALEQHIRTHTGDKPYKCDHPDCGKSFKQKSALTMHKRTHTGEKPLQCEICGKSFCESSNLSKHRKIHNAEYKYECPEDGCDKKFLRHDQLKRHMEKHKRTQLRQHQKAKARLQQQESSSVFIPLRTGTGLINGDQQLLLFPDP